MPGLGLAGLQRRQNIDTPNPDRSSREVPWYVIHTCCHHEVRVAARLCQKGIEIFLPRITVPSRRRDRNLLISVPLFPGYLFVHDVLEAPTYYEIINLPGVARILGNNGRLAAVPPETIESIKLTLASDRPFSPASYLKRGQWVRVCDGPLMGVTGIIVAHKKGKRKIVVNVELFRRSMAVELSDEAVEPWYRH